MTDQKGQISQDWSEWSDGSDVSEVLDGFRARSLLKIRARLDLSAKIYSGKCQSRGALVAGLLIGWLAGFYHV